MNRYILLIPLLIFLGLGALFLFGLQDDDDTLPSALAGRQAPELGVTPLADLALATDDALRSGDVVIVNFWASWCPPCRVEHPFLMQLQQEGLTIIGINQRDDQGDALRFLSNLGNPYAAIGADLNARTSINWGVYGLPETFVIRGDGEIVYRFAGPINEPILNTRIRPAIEAAQAN